MQTDLNEDILEIYIEQLRADASPRAAMRLRDGGEAGQPPGSEVAMLQMAAHLLSMRSGANVVDEGFVSRLREQVLAEVSAGS